MEWLGAAWAISFHHPCEGAGVNACGTVPDRGGYVAYIRTLSDGHPESDREWSLHITPPDAGEELPQIIVWSNAGDTVSCIGLGRKLNGEPYSASDCTLLLDTVTHIWSMLRHGRLASLVARSATRVRHLDDDLAMACDIQQRFLPLRLPAIDGLDYHGESSAAAGLGGDLFDFIPLGDNRLAISLGDVSGHGVASALLMSGIQAYVRRLTGEKNTDVCGLITELNRISYDISPENFFTTLFYAQIDPLNHRLDYVSAGHEPALLVRDGAQRVERLDSTGTVLGFSRRSSYGIKSLRVSPGDTLIVCSDGVSDPVYAAGSDFEFEVLEALRRDRYASAFEISQSILSVTQGPAPYTEDDRTLVVVRFSDTGLAHDLPRCAACVAA